MRKLLTIFGLTVAAVLAIAAYPYVQMTDGKILIVDGTNIYYGESVTVVAGVTASTYYDGANGAAASNLAAAALPKSGGTMTGEVLYGTNRFYLGTDTNAPWFMGLGTTNIMFGAGTNRAIFGSPW